MIPAHDCGDPTCDACRPPRSRCRTCGALHADGSVPYCSLACAAADGGAPPVPPRDEEAYGCEDE